MSEIHNQNSPIICKGIIKKGSKTRKKYPEFMKIVNYRTTKRVFINTLQTFGRKMLL